MQNKLSDLNNHLFAQLERLGDEELAGDVGTDYFVVIEGEGAQGRMGADA